MMEFNPLVALLGTPAEDPDRQRAEAADEARAARAAKAAADDAASARRQAQQAAASRRTRKQNQKIAELKSHARREQHKFMAAQHAEYRSVAERNIAVNRARASMMAASIASDLATSAQAAPHQDGGVQAVESSNIDTFA